jgi:CheY-like chemotaxis protein
MIDAGQIELVVLNLALNARDAMPGGGRVSITTANAGRGDPNRPREIATGEYIVVSVSDTGTGMTEEVLEKAFEPFFTTKRLGSGTGLGLSQVYGIAKQSGGGVRVDTQLGKGTTVAVYLPRARSAPERHAEEADAAKLSRVQEATVLVVDDDRDVRELTIACLDSLGYRIIAADSGSAALAMIDSPATVDLLLVDIAMPEMNGLEVARAVVAKRPHLPVLYMTGYVGPSALDGMERQRLLKKPFTVAELAAKVGEALHANGNDIGRSSKIVPMRPGRRG